MMIKKNLVSLFLLFVLLSSSCFAQRKHPFLQLTPAGKGFVNTKIDNIGYWKHMTDLGYVVADPPVEIPKAVYTGSIVRGREISTQDSPDIPVTDVSITTQSENSVFVNPIDEDKVLTSSNSTDWDGTRVNTIYGSDYFISSSAGQLWNGMLTGPDNDNRGDPTTAISTTGRMYVGSISSASGQAVSWSADNGTSWHEVIVSTVPSPGSDLLDKNHLWIDNSSSSPWEGNVYDAWSCFISGSSDENQIQVSRSVNGGLSWTTPIGISANVQAGSHNQGVNLKTGPDGEVYAIWSIYDSWPSDEAAIGFAKSVNGGSVFPLATRIISNIRGIRTTATNKAMRVNSFPCMAVDLSNGLNRGNIYVVWANIGVPGVNNGPDIDVYLIRSTDGGTTWSAPVKVNQDASGLGKNHFFPWITCDPDNGNLAIIYYDDRNTASTDCEAWISYSYDAGNTWQDMKVSDVSFTPGAISGLAGGYFGDYLGITSKNMKVYPVWTDNRSGRALAYVSPIDLGPTPNQPYVSYLSHDLTPIVKNGSLNMNNGDSLYLSLGLKNIGDQSSLNTVATISCSTPYIQITDSVENYGDMAVGEIKTIPDGYSFKVSDTIPDGLVVLFNIRATDGNKTWLSHFSVESHAPALKIIKLSINDTATGNHNGHLDPGESVKILVNISNTGGFACPDTWVHLGTPSEGISIPVDSIYVGLLNPGERKTVSFDLTVSDDVSFGSVIELACAVHSGLYLLRQTFRETVGMIIEDWETGNFLKFPWLFSGDLPWTLTTLNPFEGVYSARSGTIGDYQVSELKITYTSGSPDSISFYRRVSSESGYDFLNFYIDNQLQGGWSGEKPWARVSYPVTAGVHNFIWDYQKDVYTSSGEDAAWVDYIALPPPVLPVVNVPRYDTICAGNFYQTIASVSGNDSLRWTTTGDGTFSNDTALMPVYSPGTNDIVNGTARLKLTAFGQNGSTLHSTTLAIGGIPVAGIVVSPKDTVCATQTLSLSVPAQPGTTYLWMPGGFTSPTITLDTTITGGLGNRLFKVKAINLFHCSAQDSVSVTFQDCTGINEAQGSFSLTIYPNPSTGAFTLSIYAPHPEKVDIQVLNELNVSCYEENGLRVSGLTSKDFLLNDLPAGIYFLVLKRDEGKITRRLAITR